MTTDSIKKSARTAGLLYLLQIPLGVFGIMYIPKAILVTGNIAATMTNIVTNEFVVRLSIVSALICALVTVFTANYIYKVLTPVNKIYARWILLFTIIVAPISMLNELNYIAILQLLTDSEYAYLFTPDQLNNVVALLLDIHHYGLQIIGIFFGLWLLPMGYLVYKSTYIPKFIGIFLMITCLGYLIDFVTSFLFPDFGIVISEYTWIGEVMMVVWLLVKGINIPNYETFIQKQQTY